MQSTRRSGEYDALVRDRAFIRGARSLLSDYAGLKAGQFAVLVFDPRVDAVCRAIAQIGAAAGIGLTCVSAELDWATIQEYLEARCDAIVMMELDESHHTRALLQYISAKARPPCAYRLFGATAETIRHGFRVRKATLRRRNWDIIERVRRAGRLVVESDSGTRLQVGLQPGTAWSNTYGEFADGYPGVFPPAEVNTRSADVNGTLMVDGAIGSNIGWPLDARLHAHPVRLDILQGKITSVGCRNRLVRELIEEFLLVPECNEVVEIGIGTNDGIPEFVASDTLLNERMAAFHLGVGSADRKLPEENLHLDFILGRCRILAGSRVILSNGIFARPKIAAIPDRHSYEVAVALHDAV